MEFTVLKATASGNLLLKSRENEPVGRRMRLFLGNKAAAVVFETIGPVADPLYLAEPATGENLVGKVLVTKDEQ